MTVKVIKRFKDKETKELREEGTVVEYPDKRAKELIKSGHVQEAKEAEDTTALLKENAVLKELLAQKETELAKLKEAKEAKKTGHGTKKEDASV